MASNRGLSSSRCSAYPQAMLAKPCSVYDPSIEDNVRSDNATNKGTSWIRSVANAQTMLATCCSLNSDKQACALEATALNNGQSRRSKQANAHDMLDRFCAANSDILTIDSREIALRRFALSAWEGNLAKAHVVLARPCGMNSVTRSSAACAIVSIRGPCLNSNVATAQAMFDMPASESSPPRAAAVDAMECKRRSCLHSKAAKAHAISAKSRSLKMCNFSRAV
mmetsp:Transcript_42036/g.116065  ORF Transcript_42036/g.116065 Transcript_42036/m.116065 type:complete len:224 (+) Transcript_42036:1144-1815(+)